MRARFFRIRPSGPGRFPRARFVASAAARRFAYMGRTAGVVRSVLAAPTFEVVHYPASTERAERAMPVYTQTNNPMAVSTPLGVDALLLVGFEKKRSQARMALS